MRAQQVREAVETAERAFPQWAAMAASERGGLLQRASELLMERQAAIAALVTEETNGTLGWGMFSVQRGAGMLAYYANRSDATAEDEELPSRIPGKRAKAVRQPVGVVVGIAPWNAPVVLGVRAVAAPLAYGNTVVLKASEQCPRTHAAIVDALSDAGVPEGAVNLVTNDPDDAAEVVEELIAHPAVRRINEDAVERVTEHGEDAVARGAKVITGGKAHGLYFEPTVLTNVSPEMRVYSEESFGPIVAIVPVDSVDEAVRVAHDTEYGPSSAVFSRDVDAALSVASRLQTGMCHINDATVNDEPPMPFGGVKHSGWGRFGGEAALEEFTELRWISIQDSPREYAI